ncbi:MAG: hypothetical protein Q9209_001197 [Squamulea sp. 1 TL-2023]
MGKRKPGIVQFENDKDHISKRPRTDAARPTADHTKGNEPQQSIDATNGPQVERETKEARAARKLAKRLAKREYREKKTSIEKVQPRASPEGDGASTLRPTEIVESAIKPQKRPRKQSPNSAATTNRAQSPQSSDREELRKERKERRNYDGRDHGSLVPTEEDIKINSLARDNKILFGDVLGADGYYIRPGGWTLSRHSGGQMRDLDPVFSMDEKWVQQLTQKVVEQSRIIIATSGNVLTLGYTDHPNQSSLADTYYTWRDVECPEWISCIDVRIVSLDRGSKLQRSGKDFRVPRIDIVAGGLKGALHVYDDLLRQLIRTEKLSKKDPIIDLTSRKQHWHRNTVLSVKWSRDELKPTFSIAGIHFPYASDFGHLQLPFLSTVDYPDEASVLPRRLHFPAICGPSGLLCAVPSATSSRVRSTLSQHASFLQTIDIASTQKLSRQALTRTKATDLNVGPESNSIQEPDTIFMRLSHNGQWLATVDEWVPPKRDLAAQIYDNEQAVEEQDGRRETYLKFWLWDSEFKTWSLVSRVDDPHVCQTNVVGGKNRVLDLVTDPSSIGFATIGQDGVVRMWKASISQRHGSTVKNRKGRGLVNWYCRTALPLNSSALSSKPYIGAKLAYSLDGSCLAAALTSTPPWTIHFIDSAAGTATTSPYGPYTGSLFGLGIVDRFLIILSDQLYVWNMVTHELAFTYTLSPQHFPSRILKPQTKHLTVDSARGTFAIALPYVNPDPEEVRTNDHSHVIVFEPTDPTPRATMITQEPLAILTPMHGQPGYLIIDTAAEFRTLTPGRPRRNAKMALPTPPATPPQGLEDIYGHSKKPCDGASETAQKPDPNFPADLSTLSVEARAEEDDAVVVTQEKLAEVLDCGPAYAMPPVSEMFERVARLYAGSGED